MEADASKGDTEIRLSKGRHILVAVLCAILIPMGIAGYSIDVFKRADEARKIQADLAQSAKFLARGLSVSVWSLDRQSGMELIAAFAENPSISAVRVHSMVQEDFAQSGHFPENKPENGFVTTKDIIFEDQTIGRVEILYDASPFLTAQRDKWLRIWAIFVAGFLVAAASIYWFFRSTIQSERIAISGMAREAIRSHKLHILDTANNLGGLVFQCVVDQNGEFTFPFMSDSVSEYFDLTADEVMDEPQSFLSCAHPEDIDFLRSSLMRAAVGDGDWEWEGRFLRPSGENIYMRGSASARQYKEGLTLWNCVLTDITELHQARQKIAKARDNLEAEVALRTKRLISEIEEKVRIESSLRDNEQRFKDFTETATDWVWETDEHQNIIFLSVNTATQNLFDTGSVIGMSRYELFNAKPGGEDEVWVKHYEDIAQRNEFHDVEFDFVDLHGEARRLRVNGRPVYNDNGKYIGYRGTGKDVTLETESKLGLEKLRAAFEAVPVPMAVLDSNYCFEFFNSAYREVNQECGKSLKLGVKFPDFIRTIVESGIIADAIGNEEEWISKRLKMQARETGSAELSHSNGQWYLLNEHALSNGGRALLMTNITELKESEQSLKEAKDQAEAANQAKSDFLSSMSHELRTPLHAILGYAQLLERDGQENLSDRQDRFVRQIVGSGNHLLGLIGDVLDLAQIESGSLSMSIESMSVKDAVEDTIEATSYLAGSRQITLHATKNLNQSVPDVFADPTRVRQVLLNLASNGIKYTTEKGRVEFDVEVRRDNMLRIYVRDDGDGIPEEKKTELFSAFSRLGMEKSEIEGTGIGLTISKAIVEEMGGEIGFESSKENGTCFWFDLPIAGAAPLNTVADNPGVEVASGDATRSLRVLHVNESMYNTELLEIALSDRPDLDFSRSSKNEDLLMQIQASMPDILFVDMDKDEEGRLKLIHAIKECPETSHIPLIVLSLNRTEKSRRRVLEAGGTECLFMPLDPDDVYEQIEKVRESANTVH